MLNSEETRVCAEGRHDVRADYLQALQQQRHDLQRCQELKAALALHLTIASILWGLQFSSHRLHRKCLLAISMFLTRCKRGKLSWMTSSTAVTSCCLHVCINTHDYGNVSGSCMCPWLHSTHASSTHASPLDAIRVIAQARVQPAAQDCPQAQQVEFEVQIDEYARSCMGRCALIINLPAASIILTSRSHQLVAQYKQLQ